MGYQREFLCDDFKLALEVFFRTYKYDLKNCLTFHKLLIKTQNLSFKSICLLKCIGE